MINPIEQQRVRILINGIVQGVGFRPHVYRYALEYQLTGTVLNDSQGVTIELQGDKRQIQLFINCLKEMPPPLARIDKFEVVIIPIISENSIFEIIQSQQQSQAVVAVSADKSSCEACNQEIMDPANRHYQYPFTNCTNCGPRYTLIQALPYDRENTSMAKFPMCEQCAESYQNPLNRRYHAQPVSCPNCGPSLTLTTNQGRFIAEKQNALDECIHRLKLGQVLAIKGLGGFHLVCDATNSSAVAALRLRKHRPTKPFAIMVANLDTAKQLVLGNDKEWELLSSQARPITLMKKHPTSPLRISENVAPNIDKLGLFLPYTPLHHLLLKELNRPIVATSANLSGEPIITNSRKIQEKLGNVVDAILDHDREILNACDDSVVQVIDNQIQVMRLARGYAPLSLPIKDKQVSTSIAVGAQQKNTIAFGFDHNIFISPHIGDLNSIETEDYFETTLETFKRLYKLKPSILIHDKHPDYSPTRWAKDRSKNADQLIPVQHHYAHVLSVMAANQYTNSVMGFSFDGTGLGDDGNLWGSEAMIADTKGFSTICQFSPFQLIGAEEAIKDPRRVLLAILFQRYSINEIYDLKLPVLNSCSPQLISNLHKIWKNNSHCINTSSAGRIFDAVAYALGLVEQVEFDGQAGMLLESAANNNKEKPIKFTLKKQNNQWQTVHFLCDIISAISEQQLTDKRIGQISAGFMEAIAISLCQIASEHKSLPIALCGGVFQNRYLHELCRSKLTASGHKILVPGLVPINDEGISLGQLWYAINQ
ncbi:hydrogenase metallocenter (NiFe) assembly protein HypF [Photobacterium marinum]|uniref:Carbamoyltransferase HypF n=1 Tax=Photobacterium marinum TaxID=1056511 RepID=L8JAB6_9GAMM|nr:carbamoyltransferase HypF [Photobacterium marinum]ELR64499.1 hydrogenase metallocenter (NiFe) assembly protein HypF [Photobacterium marinum]